MRLSLRGCSVVVLLPAVCSAATLHGRIKDQRCEVLSQVTVHVRPATPQHGGERTLNTDDGGNYTVDLPAGDYQVCVQRGKQTIATCTGISVVGEGDTWITTQLRDAVPDLSRFGNHAE